MTFTLDVNMSHYMMYDINSLDELIAELDGPSGAAGLFQSRDSAICNWRARGYVPPSRHLTILVELKKRGKTIDPAVLDRSKEDFDILFGCPRKGSRVSASA